MDWFCQRGAILGNKEYKMSEHFLSPYYVAGRFTMPSHFISMLLLITRTRNRRLRKQTTCPRSHSWYEAEGTKTRAVQHQSHLSTAPTKGHSKGTCTFWGSKCGIEKVWAAFGLPACSKDSFLRLIPWTISGLPYHFCPPRRALKNVQRKKKPKKSIISTRPRFAIMTSILQRSVYTLIRFPASIALCDLPVDETQCNLSSIRQREVGEFLGWGMREKWKRAYYAESLRQSSLLWTTLRPEPRCSRESDSGWGAWDIPLWERIFWEAAARKKGEKRQHPEHFKFICYIFTQLNQAQKQKEESHVSTSFPRASPNTAGCLRSPPFVITRIQLALLSAVHGPGSGLRASNALSHFILAKVP